MIHGADIGGQYRGIWKMAPSNHITPARKLNKMITHIERKNTSIIVIVKLYHLIVNCTISGADAGY